MNSAILQSHMTRQEFLDWAETQNARCDSTPSNPSR